jgi:hypothetical protein
MTTPTLSKLKDTVEFGSDEEVSRFIQENWKELPPKLQDHLSVGILIDAIDGQMQKEEEFETFRTSVLEVLEEIVTEAEKTA